MTSLAIKYKKIEEDKLFFTKQIDDVSKQIENNISMITNIIASHNEFHNFIKIIDLLEYYKWCTLKNDYKQIKKNINRDKKLYRLLSDLYGNIISYYTPLEIEKYNKILQVIGESHMIMLYNYERLKNIHKDMYIKIKGYIKNNMIIKITNVSDEMKPILVELYKLYIDLKFHH
jgi:hypothetical protein